MTKRNLHLYILVASIQLLVVATPVFSQKRKNSQESKPNEIRLREAEFFFSEAEKYFILEDYAKALLYFQRVSELNPTNATVHYKIAEVLAKGTKEEDIQKAAQSIELALKYEKKNKYFYLLASNIYANLGQFEKATTALETMLKEVKGTEDYLFELAALYLYDKKEDEALKVYNRAEDIMGVNEVSSQQKQRIYLDKGKIPEALAESEKLLQAYPDEERYVLGFAETLSMNGQRNKAIQYLENFIKDHPEAGNAKMVLAGLYKDDGQEEKSRSYVLEVFDDPQVNVSSKVLMMGTYNAMLSQNQSKKINDPELETFVVNLFKKLETNYSTDPNVHLVGGDLYMTLEKDEDAKREYLKAVRSGSASFEAWQNLLYLETQSNQIDSLIAHSEEALEMFPNQAMVHYFNGYGHLRKKQFREASYSLEQAKKLSTSNPAFVSELNGMLGDCYNATKEYAKSDQAYEEALAFNPNNDIVLNNYSYYLALRKENLEKAEKMAAQLVKNFPENPSYLDTYAWVLFERGKYKEAKKTIEKAIQSGQGTATHFEHYGDILFQLGDIDNAVKQWQKAKQKDGDNASLDKKITNRKLN
ncbi:MAG TPA: tetratricopeptide repeat protein [Cyclobacteriaceae bacterium]|nr:tetratricopeptide repeat protein [Cyclobacteriaceae bacterium]